MLIVECVRRDTAPSSPSCTTPHERWKQKVSLLSCVFPWYVISRLSSPLTGVGPVPTLCLKGNSLLLPSALKPSPLVFS